MIKISLIPGENDSPADGAFDPAKMRAAGIDSMILTQALTKALLPFAGLLRDGCGFGVIDNGSDVSVVGLADLLN